MTILKTNCINAAHPQRRADAARASPQNSPEESVALRVNATRRFLYRVNSRHPKAAPPRRVFMVFMVAFFMVFIAFMEALLGAMAGLGREEGTYWWSQASLGFSMASKQ